ncbi:hypothetical protein [Serratia rubidaea]|uniref:Uncharacterized protein n=1 Tax=Serratia rubidaea TaxID=61652 RepID=A0A3S4WLW5_SERRU|nr:hypothetical protein [Serratia rubidaea]MDC6118562.1 hypothetical protein [Serratia rubidaea]MDK1702644.1 hypothetical protein [Serratia rubidaea]WBF47133.1 hypothetical protein OLD77_08830 [Serratia rubidaea]VEI68827.1 Uncharacterised protein [Serratia rubidaea]
MQNTQTNQKADTVSSKKQEATFTLNVKKKANQEERRALGALVK